MAKKRKKVDRRGGTHGIFQDRRGLMWVSGQVTSDAFEAAKQRLIAAYVLVFNRPPAKVTKPDVLEFALVGEEETIRRLSRMAVVGGRPV